MNLISKILILITFLQSFTGCNAQLKNVKTENIKIYGNCGMCKSTIEKAGNIKKVSKVDWNQETMLATISFDTMKTNQEDILKRIALVGYDSDLFRAPDNIYAELPECCQYERPSKLLKIEEKIQFDTVKIAKDSNSQLRETKQDAFPLKSIFNHYFSIKDALVRSNAKEASAIANEFILAIGMVNMEHLNTTAHDIWMKVKDDLNENTKGISRSLKIEQQRTYFISLSKNIYDLIKVSKQETPTFFQHCPMANDGKGADWLSKENVIRNPYFGSQMLTCGKTIETIK